MTSSNNPTPDAEYEAAEAVLAAMTDWFIEDDSNPEKFLKGHSAQYVIEVLFGLLVASVRNTAEVAGTEPLEIVQSMALSVLNDIYGDTEEAA